MDILKDDGRISHVDDLGRIHIPKEVREKFGIKEGDSFKFSVSPNGKICMTRWSGDTVDSDDRNFDFHWKFGDFEISTVRERYTNDEFRYDNDSPINERIPIELVKWEDNGHAMVPHSSCFTVAYWEQDEYGDYELRFVGSRPFEHVAPDEIAEIWKQLSAAQRMLDLYARVREG